MADTRRTTPMTAACPDEETLARMLDGPPGGPEARAVGPHVAACPDCRRALERLTLQDSRSTEASWGRPAEAGGAETLSGSGDLVAGRPGPGPAAETLDAGPTPGAGRDEGRPPELPGYRIERELGRGGMGVVYLATQVQANRPVALKMVASGRGGPDDLLRFRLEGESLARLRHQNIIQVYEVGIAEGRPYFSMEYVDGGTLADALADSAVAPREAAALVEALARAVHVAHQCGVIHRDLKPANVLLAEGGRTRLAGSRDGRGLAMPKVTDFGLAKLVGTDSGLTHTGQILGTPGYMAPEQAAGHRSVGVPADVYSLGVILYEALAGRVPFRGESPWKTMMLVVHEAPTPPSRHRPGLPRDLEVICLKCLAKEPEGRYASADALAEDLRRWLDDEPIRARPASLTRRSVLWGRRHPAMASMIALLVAVAAAGSAGVLAQWRRAEAGLARSQANLALAVEAIEGFHSGVSEDVLLKEPALKELRAKLLGSALRFYRKLQDQQLDPAGGGSPAELADAYERVARLCAEVGSKSEALEAYQRALGLRLEVAKAAPSDRPARRALAGVYSRIADVQFDVATPEVSASWHRLALAEHERAASTGGGLGDRLEVASDHVALGRVLGETARTGEALGHFEAARGQLQALLDGHPGDFRTRRDLAMALYQSALIRLKTLSQTPETVGRLEQADALLAGLVDARRDDMRLRLDRAQVLYQVGCALDQLGQARESLDRYAVALEVLRPVADANPTLLDVRRAEADLRLAVGIALDNLGRGREAVEEYDRARAIFEAMARENPRVPVYRMRVAACLTSLAMVRRKLGDAGAARRLIEAAIEIREGLARQDPSTTMYRVLLADDYGEIGNQDRQADRRESARLHYRKAVDILDALPPGNLTSRYNLACFLASCAELTPEAAERRRLADRAMAQLLEAVAAGYTHVNSIRSDRDLDILKGRDDYRAMILDLAFPADPFRR